MKTLQIARENIFTDVDTICDRFTNGDLKGTNPDQVLNTVYSTISESVIMLLEKYAHLISYDFEQKLICDLIDYAIKNYRIDVYELQFKWS